MDLEPGDDEPLRECGPPTAEEREALLRIFREHGVDIADDAPLTVVREHTPDALRADAEAIAKRFERGER